MMRIRLACVIAGAVVSGSSALAADVWSGSAQTVLAPVTDALPVRHGAFDGAFMVRSGEGSMPSIQGGLARGSDCPPEGPLQYWTGSGDVTCPCFASGERASVAFTIPPEHFPIEILEIGIGWGSVLGSAPATVEESILVYNGTLTNPGFPVADLLAPQMVDGFINVFDVSIFPEPIVIESGTVIVALEFANANAGQTFDPSVVHDGNGCTAGRNGVFVLGPTGWRDACSLGLGGDWLFHIVYRPAECDEEPECPGDVTMDGNTDFTDLNVVLAFFGQSGPMVSGDTNGDQIVNFTDLNAVLATFGTSCR